MAKAWLKKDTTDKASYRIKVPKPRMIYLRRHNEIAVTLDGKEAPQRRFLEFILIYPTSEGFPVREAMAKGKMIKR